MSMSSGSPGSSWRLMPSIPASISALNARYGFAVGSGERNSIRLLLGDSWYIGTRTHAERLRAEKTRFTGAS